MLLITLQAGKQKLQKLQLVNILADSKRMSNASYPLKQNHPRGWFCFSFYFLEAMIVSATLFGTMS